jgi:hypothetical protein
MRLYTKGERCEESKRRGTSPSKETKKENSRRTQGSIWLKQINNRKTTKRRGYVSNVAEVDILHETVLIIKEEVEAPEEVNETSEKSRKRKKDQTKKTFNPTTWIQQILQKTSEQ